jgi:starch synthase
MRLVVHGAGDARIVRSLAALAADHRDWFVFEEGHDDVLVHRLLAAGDVLVVPSRDEPCGTAQLAAMRYGTIPVVTAVGGLRDTVPDADWTDEGNGFVADRVESIALVSALFRAARLLADRRRKRALVRRIMELDWSWRAPAAEHAAVYAEVAAAVTSFQRNVR